MDVTRVIIFHYLILALGAVTMFGTKVSMPNSQKDIRIGFKCKGIISQRQKTRRGLKQDRKEREREREREIARQKGDYYLKKQKHLFLPKKSCEEFWDQCCGNYLIIEGYQHQCRHNSFSVYFEQFNNLGD